MAKKSPQRLSEQQRAERRRQDRERLQQAARELLGSEGWARWVKTRAMFRSYSAVILRAAVIDRVEWARGRRRHVIDAGPVRT
jgi:hypothetical protein